MSNIFQCL